MNEQRDEEDGWTNLHNACQDGDLTQVRDLIEGGHRINVRTLENLTPLHCAVNGNHLHIVKYLVETEFPKYGENMIDIVARKRVFKNTKNSFKGTPLQCAVYNEYLEIVECLIQNKADVRIQDEDGWNCLHTACSSEILKQRHLEILEQRHLKILELITKKGTINKKDKDGMSPLHYATLSNHLETVKFLIENTVESADVNIQDNIKKTPLHYACRDNLKEIVSCLLENNRANIYIEDENGKTPSNLATDPSVINLFEN
jgi:ankyrin repeat protein